MDSRSVGSSICPQEPCRVQGPSRPSDMLWDTCHTGWFLPPAGKPHSSPDGRSHIHPHPLLRGHNRQEQKDVFKNKSIACIYYFYVADPTFHIFHMSVKNPKMTEKHLPKPTFLFFPSTFALFLGGHPENVRKHGGAVDADVIKVWLFQEVVLTLGNHTIQMDPHAKTSTQHKRLESARTPAHRGRFLLLPTLAWLGFCLFGLGFLLYLLGTFSPLSYSWSWNTKRSAIISVLL